MTTERVEAIYPLSPMQQGMLFHSLADSGSEVYVETLTCEIHGPLDVAAFERAWNRVVARHAALRTSFAWEGLEQGLQVVHEEVDVPLEQRDPRELPADERGFDLARPPLVRLFLHPISPRAYRFTWSFHHALLDGWSSSLVIREVLEIYEALIGGREPVLAPPRGHREWMAWLARRNRAAAEAFWRGRLAGFESPTRLVGARSGDVSARGAASHEERSFRLSAASTAALAAFGREHRLTANTLLLGAWAIFLARTSGEEDVVFGSTVSGRSADLPGMDERVGLFINTLPIRARVAAPARLLPWLQALQRDLVATGAHDWTPLADVQKWSDVPRGVPLFDSLVVLENYPSDSLAPENDAGIEVRRVEVDERASYPVVLTVAPGPELELAIGFDSTLFCGDAVERILSTLATLLEGMVARPDETLGGLPLVDDVERRRMLVEWNETATAFPDNACVHELFEEQCDRAPDAVAVVFGETVLSYHELDRRANWLAHRLRSLGVGPEARVAVCLDRSADLVVALLAILKAGGAYVPLDPGYPAERLALLLDDVRASAIVTASRVASRLPRRDIPVVRIDDERAALEREPTGRPAGGARADNLAYVIYTSGSTGSPKGIAVPHRAVVRLVRNTSYAAIDDGDRVAQASSASFDAATFEIWGALANGATLVGIERDVALSPPEFAAEIRDRGITTLFLTTALFNQLASEASGAFAGLGHLLFGGEKVDPNRVREALDHGAPRRLVHVYGPTEGTTFSSWHLVDAVAADATTVPIGRPLSNARLHVLDRDLELIPVGVPGELCIGGAGLARGYLARPDLTAEAFVPDPFATTPGERLYRTGDLVRRLSDGSIEFLGRLDDQVKVRGFRVEPAEIANILRLHVDVQDAVVVAREDAPGDRRLVAYVVARRESAPGAGDLRRFVSEKLPEHLVPAAVVFLDAIPLNRNGKVDRRALPPPARDRPEVGGDFVAPRTPVEETLARIWTDVLRLDRVGVNDGFFQLGGDSILTIQIVSRAREAGVVVTPRQIFQHPTIAALAAVAGTSPLAAWEQGAVTGPAPLTPIQEWFFAQELPDRHHFNQAMLLELRERVDPSLLERALERLVEQHDALRLRFDREPSGWRQSHATPPIRVPLERIDLSGVTPSARAAAIEATATRAQEALSLARGPLVRAALFDLGDARSPASGDIGGNGAGGGLRLLLVLHHLVVDVVSWRILLEDLETTVDAVRRGEEVRLPPKTTSFKRWAESLADLARSDDVARDAAHWLARSAPPVAQLPLDHPGGSNRESDARTVTVSLDDVAPRALLESAAAAHHATVEEALLASLALALANGCGVRRFLVDLEGHGRRAPSSNGDELDLTRTVGWFTTIYPVVLDAGEAREPADALRAVKEELRAVPRHGLGWGLLRFSSARRDLAATLSEIPAAEVSFNYLGDTDAALASSSLFAEASEPVGPCFGLRGARAHVLDVNASLTGGRLHVDWTYSEALHRRETVESIARAFLEALRALASAARGGASRAITPADFPEADLDAEELQALAMRFREAVK